MPVRFLANCIIRARAAERRMAPATRSAAVVHGGLMRPVLYDKIQVLPGELPWDEG
jgi:hypothetical protein